MDILYGIGFLFVLLFLWKIVRGKFGFFTWVRLALAIFFLWLPGQIQQTANQTLGVVDQVKYQANIWWQEAQTWLNNASKTAGDKVGSVASDLSSSSTASTNQESSVESNGSENSTGE
ncbi:MAG: hypothetical protein LBM27_06520 [Lactobacillaceae bacterium]|jgi:hypothetical protein|nr:hypothetical protein [Lactobacillaceae bacterium]